MADRITNWLLLKYIHQARLVRGAQRHLLNALAIRANTRKGYTCVPSYATLMKDTGLSDPSLRAAARDLEAAGLIVRRNRPSSSNLFKVNAERIKQEAEQVQSEEKRLERELNAAEWKGSSLEALDNTDGLAPK